MHRGNYAVRGRDRKLRDHIKIASEGVSHRTPPLTLLLCYALAGLPRPARRQHKKRKHDHRHRDGVVNGELPGGRAVITEWEYDGPTPGHGWVNKLQTTMPTAAPRNSR